MAKTEYALSILTDCKGQLFIHADAEGLAHLIVQLERLKSKVEAGESDHSHMFTRAWGGDTLSECTGNQQEGEIIHHVKLYGWTKEWAKKHGFLD